MTAERTSIDGTSVRVRGVPATLQDGQRAVVVVGDSLRLRDSSLTSLNRLLLIALPVALLVAAFAGYEVAGAALRPVDRIRSRAATISESNPSDRLPVPEARDEIAALASTLNEMLSRLEAALGRERRLVSDASHELRTPLTTLRAELELALRGERDVAELRAAIASAHEEARRMSALADDLLVLARADQGRLPLRPQPCVAEDLARSRASTAPKPHSHRPDAQSQRTTAARARSWCWPTRTAWRKRSTTWSPTRCVTATAQLTCPWSGPGRWSSCTSWTTAPASTTTSSDHAFERFRRDARGGGDNPRGAGLGLAIVEAIARAHGGAAAARNRPAGGADVWLTLPEA